MNINKTVLQSLTDEQLAHIEETFALASTLNTAIREYEKVCSRVLNTYNFGTLTLDENVIQSGAEVWFAVYQERNKRKDAAKKVEEPAIADEIPF